MHGAALDWTVLCTLVDGPDRPTGECHGGGPIRDYEVFKRTNYRRPAARKFSRVLDVGSLDINGCMGTYNFLQPGGKLWMEEIAAFPGAGYCGLDIMDGPNVNVVGDAHAMPFVDANFDLALCLNMLEHDTDGEATLREIYRVLEPRGELVLVCTNEHGAEHAHLGGGQKEFFRHWPEDELKAVLHAAGFTFVHFTHGGDNLVWGYKL